MFFLKCPECNSPLPLKSAYQSSSLNPCVCKTCQTKFCRKTSIENYFTGILFGVFVIGAAIRLLLGFSPMLILVIATVSLGFVLDKLEFCFSPLQRLDTMAISQKPATEIIHGFALGSLYIIWFLLKTIAS